MVATRKEYLYKIFSVSGTTSTFLGTWNDVIGFPRFEVNINAGLGEMTVDLARSWDAIGEGGDVKQGNLVKVYVADRDTGHDDAKLLASGYISGYTPNVQAGQEEKCTVTVLGNSVRLNDALLTSSGNTLVTFYSTDPTSILSTIMGLYNTTVSGAISFATNFDNTGTQVSYAFDMVTYKQALDKILELSPQRWYYTIDPNDTIQFHPRRWSADHTLVIGQHINSIQPFKNIEDVRNVVWVVGDGIKSMYRNATSIILYGEKVYVLQDRRLSVQASLDIVGNSYLLAHASPETRTTLTVVDSNGDDSGRGYDIDSFQVGQMVSIVHPNVKFERTLWDESRWDESKWDAPVESVLSTPMQIMRISYAGDNVTLELSTRAPEISKRLEDINRNLQQFISATVL